MEKLSTTVVEDLLFFGKFQKKRSRGRKEFDGEFLLMRRFKSARESWSQGWCSHGRRGRDKRRSSLSASSSIRIPSLIISFLNFSSSVHTSHLIQQWYISVRFHSCFTDTTTRFRFALSPLHSWVSHASPSSTARKIPFLSDDILRIDASILPKYLTASHPKCNHPSSQQLYSVCSSSYPFTSCSIRKN